MPDPVYRNIFLPLSGITWITYADLPYSYTFASVQEDLEKLFPEGFLVRGCSDKTAGLLGRQGGLAAVTVSERGDHAAHTELMLKQESAPSGIMEMLLAGIFKTLRNEGYAEWSLGEVPFYDLVNTDGEQFSFEEHVVALTAGLCRYAYDFKGLYSFKNKFGPEWRDVYLYSKREFSLLTFADLAVKSRYSELLAHTMFDTFRRPFS